MGTAGGGPFGANEGGGEEGIEGAGAAGTATAAAAAAAVRELIMAIISNPASLAFFLVLSFLSPRAVCDLVLRM